MPQQLKCVATEDWDAKWKLNGEYFTGTAFKCKSSKYNKTTPYFLDPNDAYNCQEVECVPSSELTLLSANFNNGWCVFEEGSYCYVDFNYKPSAEVCTIEGDECISNDFAKDTSDDSVSHTSASRNNNYKDYHRKEKSWSYWD